MDFLFLSFILVLGYCIFFLWLVWSKAPWSIVCKILVTIGVAVVVSLIPLGLIVLPESGGCEDFVQLGQ